MATPVSDPPASEEYQPVKSAERTVRILEALASSPSALSVADLQARTGYPRSSLHALVRTLRDLKWVEADESGSRFGVGPHALLSGTAYLDRDPAIPYAWKALEDLRSEVNHTVHFARRDEDSVIYLASRESTIAIRRVYRVGRKLPTHITALGQAMLAELTTAEVDAVLPDPLPGLTPNSITDRAALHAELDLIRGRGWALEIEQGMPGIACVASVVNYRIPATDAISCSMPVELTADTAELDRITTAVVGHSRQLGESLRRAGIR